MRIMIKANMRTEKGNELAQKGKLGQVIHTIVEELKPEAAYFTAEKGRRTAMMFMEVGDSSEIPRIAEPFFLAFDAEVEIWPVMNVQDLGRAEGHIEEATKRYR